MFRIEIPVSSLKAVSRFAVKADIRYYINGVRVEVYANVAYLVATNGHMMAICRLHTEREGRGAETIPCEVIAQAVKTKSAILSLQVEDAADPEGEAEFALVDPWKGTKLSGKTTGGRFPDWGRVVPRALSGEVATFNPEYLMAAQKAAEDLNRHALPIAIAHNGDSAGVVNLSEDCFAVIMPLRADRPESAPAWAFDNPEEVGRLDLESAWDDAYAPAPAPAELVE